MSRWHSCNIFQPDPERSHLWQFRITGDHLKLDHHQSLQPGEALPPRLVAKDWQTLYQKKLNVACLPADKLFLRVIQIPAADFNEAQAMVELQLEKLSPMPVPQVVWTFELLSGTHQSLRTAIVVIAARDYVESFLGRLEGQGYLADRLEIPFLDQLLVTKAEFDGVWVYPGVGEDRNTCLVAWWYGGIIQNLVLLHVPPEPDAGPYLRHQLAQMAWAGEVEGWLTASPRRHLVADPDLAAVWAPRLKADGEPVEIIEPLAVEKLAALTVKRAATADHRGNLLPPDYATRYRQQFIDRIWMRGVGALLVFIVAGTLIYLGALQFLRFQVNKVEKDFAARGASYTNAMKLKAEVQVLQDQIDLQYAALECWKAVATLLPAELTLEGINFQRGKTLTIFGTGPGEGTAKVSDYNEVLSQATYKDELLFRKVSTRDIRTVPSLRWTLEAEIKRNLTE